MKFLTTFISMFLMGAAAVMAGVVQTNTLNQSRADARYVNTWAAGDTMSGPLTLLGSSLTVTGAMQAGGGGGDATAGDITVDPTGKAVYVGRLSGTSGNQSTFIIRNRTNGAIFTADPINDFVRVAVTQLIGVNGTFSGPITTASSMTVTGNAFSVGGSTLVVAGGKVGIGTNAPNSKLEIVDPVTPFNLRSIAGAAGSNDAIEFGMNASLPRFDFVVGGAYKGQVSQSATDTIIKNYVGTTGKIDFRTNNGSDGSRMIILAGGNVGIGTTAPTSKLSVEEKTWIDGYARGVYAANKSGVALSSGTIVSQINQVGFNITITTAAAQSEFPVGTIYDTSCAAPNGTLCRVCTDGICPVKLDTGEACATSDNLVVTGDGLGTADCLPDTTARHNGEVGQIAEFPTGTGATILIWAHRN